MSNAGLELLTIVKAERGFCLESTLRLPRPLAEVFPFFADAGNLETITPPSLHFDILSPKPISMHHGRLIDYRIRIHGIPVRWRSEIAAWDPPYRFVDQQRLGPYKWWRHEHRFEAHGDHTLIHDHVEYGVPGGGLVNRLFVERDLLRIFRYRAETLLRLFPERAANAGVNGTVRTNGHARHTRDVTPRFAPRRN